MNYKEKLNQVVEQRMIELRAGKSSSSWSHLNEGKKVKLFWSEGPAIEKRTRLGGQEDSRKASVPEAE